MSSLMEPPEELERRAEHLEEEAILLEEAGRTVAAQVKAQQAKTLRDRASLLGQQTGPTKAFATDKTSQKVVDFQSNPSCELPPAVDQLQSFLLHPLSAKVPVPDSMYNSLVAHNDSLQAIIEPVTTSRADALASLVSSALQTNFEGGDEIVIAGQVDELLYKIWHCINSYDADKTFTISRKRNRADESATLKGMRPDLCITVSRALLFKGEDKTKEGDLVVAINELGTKLSNWGSAYHGKVKYLMCYACAGSRLQFCVLPWGIKVPRTLGPELSLAATNDKLRVVAIAIQMYQVLKAQSRQLPDHYLPLGYSQSTAFSTIDFFDGFVQKRVEYSEAWPETRQQVMVDVYKACDASPYLIHAMQPPSKPSGGVTHYVVNLEPVGEPLLSDYSNNMPSNQAELKTCIKCVVLGVQQLHKAKIGHTDIRWQNLIKVGDIYIIIDMEFACRLKQMPFTPKGHVRQARPELYSRSWKVADDLMLIGDLMNSCEIPDMDDQGKDLMHAMQAGQMSAGKALQHEWLD